MKKLHDHYFEKAKKEHYAARSVYKLEEIDARFRLLRPGSRVLDLGCAPGSWCQYAAKKVGPGGIVVGVDIQKTTATFGSNVHILEMDVHAPDNDALRQWSDQYDVVISDMAPSTTGIKSVDHDRSIALVEAALGIAVLVLKPGGGFVCKVFQGADFNKLVAGMKPLFDQVKIVKPQGSRKESKEIFLVATGFRGELRAVTS